MGRTSNILANPTLGIPVYSLFIAIYQLCICRLNNNPISNFFSVRRPSTIRPEQDFSKSSCSCCCPLLLSCSFLVPLGLLSHYPFTLSIHFFGCLLLLLFPWTCPYSATIKNNNVTKLHNKDCCIIDLPRGSVTLVKRKVSQVWHSFQMLYPNGITRWTPGVIALYTSRTTSASGM